MNKFAHRGDSITTIFLQGLLCCQGRDLQLQHLKHEPADSNDGRSTHQQVDILFAHFDRCQGLFSAPVSLNMKKKASKPLFCQLFLLFGRLMDEAHGLANSEAQVAGGPNTDASLDGSSSFSSS